MIEVQKGKIYIGMWRIHQLLPNSELHWIKGEAHFPHEGAPEEMNLIVADWLRARN